MQMSEEEMISQVRYAWREVYIFKTTTYTFIRSLLLAGYETTAGSLTWTTLELARHPNIQNKLRREIREKQREVQARGDSEFSPTDFDSMVYLTAVLKV